MLACGLGGLVTLLAFQRPFREFPGRENPGLPLPPDWREQTEWVFARLMYPPAFGGRRRGFGGGGFGGGNTPLPASGLIGPVTLLVQ